MKLYATVSSERATKGQGGNDYVNVDFLYQEQGVNKTLARVNLVIEEGEARLYIDNHGIVARKAIKGEQRKGECDCIPIVGTRDNLRAIHKRDCAAF